MERDPCSSHEEVTGLLHNRIKELTAIIEEQNRICCSREIWIRDLITRKTVQEIQIQGLEAENIKLKTQILKKSKQLCTRCYHDHPDNGEHSDECLLNLLD